MTCLHYKARRFIFLTIIALFFSLISTFLLAENVWDVVDRAFRAGVEYDQSLKAVVVRVDVQKGYYAYRSSIQANSDVQLEKPIWPTGQVYDDPYFGKQEVFLSDFVLQFPLQDQTKKTFTYFDFTLQGCQKNGPCLPPRTKRFLWSTADNAFILNALPVKNQPKSSWVDLGWYQVLAVFLLGLLMVINPCSLPVLGTLFLLIAGQHKTSTAQSAHLVLGYGFGLLLSYFLLAFLVFYFAQFLQVYLQNWVVKLFLVLFLLCCAAWVLWGHLLPSFSGAWKDKLHQALLGVRFVYGRAFLLGFANLVFISACSAPLLAGLIAQVGTSKHLVVWEVGIFALIFALGASLPLILIALFGQKMMPKSGPYLLLSKRLIVYVLLVLAFWNSTTLISGEYLGVIWLAMLGFCLFDMVRLVCTHMASRLLPIGTLLLGALLVSVYWVESGVVRYHWADSPNEDVIDVVSKTSELIHLLETVNRPKLVLLYADWCISCLKEKHFFLNNTAVRAYVKRLAFVFFDVTAMAPEHVAFLSQKGLVGPPAFLLFDQKGIDQVVEFLPSAIDDVDDLKQVDQMISHYFD